MERGGLARDGLASGDDNSGVLIGSSHRGCEITPGLIDSYCKVTQIPARFVLVRSLGQQQALEFGLALALPSSSECMLVVFGLRPMARWPRLTLHGNVYRFAACDSLAISILASL